MPDRVQSGSPETAPTVQNTPAEDEISILDLLIVLAKHKKLILGLPFGAAVIAAIVTLLMPNIYTGTTKILPPQQSQSAAIAMLGQLGTLGGLAGSALGVRNPNDLYIGMLRSRTVSDSLIARFELKKIYETKTSDDTRRVLEGSTRISSGKDGIIVIEFDDREPKRAATIANAYVEELYKLTQSLAVTEASQRRLFFERQLDQTRKNLANAETAARQGLEKGGLVAIDAQGRGMVETTARLRGQITVKEIQISAMRAFATGENPDLKQAQHELDAMKLELAKMEGTSSGRDKAGSVGKADGMENLRLLRDVKYFETIFEMLAKQYEIAKIDEARDASIVQVLDPAVEPERKSKPTRSVIVIVTALMAGFLTVAWAFIKEAAQRARQNPEQAPRLEALNGYLRWRR
jgi:uncharacterized protein involved in exopolysaccharide biosynthesis